MWSKSRCLAIFSLTLFTFDIGSDGFVGGDLIWRCHQKYGMSVFFFVLLPGFIWGWFNFYEEKYNDDGRSLKGVLKAISAPIWFIPNGWWRLLQAVIQDGDESNLREAKL